MEISSAISGVGLIIALTGVAIGYQLQQLRYAILALVSLSVKKGTLPPVNLDKLAYRAVSGRAEPTTSHIHFPNSMFPEQTDEDRLRKNPPTLR